jgi:hypothetical protein
VGVGAADGGVAVAGASTNGVGPDPMYYADGKWKRTDYGVLTAGLLMDGATTAGNKLSVFSTMMGVASSVDGGQSFTASTGFAGPSMDVRILPDDKTIAVVGSFASKSGGFSGVAVSADGEGKTWDTSRTIDKAVDLRYADYPTSDTWYVTAGMWNTTDSSSMKQFKAFEDSHETFEMSSRLNLGPELSPAERKRRHSKRRGDAPEGWWGKIYKTTDGGKTWATSFETSSTDYYYFNAVSCGTADSCVAVAEGITADGGSTTLAMQTTDGGKSWKNVFTDNSLFSLMAVKMTSATDGWLAGALHKGGMQGQFYTTTDGGATWTLKQSLSNCFPVDVDVSPDGKTAVAACLSNTGTSAQVAMYQ